MLLCSYAFPGHVLICVTRVRSSQNWTSPLLARFSTNLSVRLEAVSHDALSKYNASCVMADSPHPTVANFFSSFAFHGAFVCRVQFLSLGICSWVSARVYRVETRGRLAALDTYHKRLTLISCFLLLLLSLCGRCLYILWNVGSLDYACGWTISSRFGSGFHESSPVSRILLWC